MDVLTCGRGAFGIQLFFLNYDGIFNSFVCFSSSLIDLCVIKHEHEIDACVMLMLTLDCVSIKVVSNVLSIVVQKTG